MQRGCRLSVFAMERVAISTALAVDGALQAAASPPEPLPFVLANSLPLDDLQRRSDSPVAFAPSPSSSTSASPAGSASVTSPVRIPPSPLRDAVAAQTAVQRPGLLAAVQGLPQNSGAGVRFTISNRVPGQSES